MKRTILLFGICCSIIDGFSQKVQQFDSHQTIFIRAKNDSAFFDADRFEYEVKDFVFDSCNYYRNSFQVTFEIQNQTGKAFIAPYSSFISWYDASYFRAGSSDLLLIKPGEKKRVTLEVVAYQKTRMNNRGDLQGDWDGKELKLPLRVYYAVSKKKCD